MAMYDNYEIKDELNIRYTKITFELLFDKRVKLKKYKSSALRGGMGQMLLKQNCISDRQCDKCDFESECIVRRTMYSKMKRKPSFMMMGDSLGYILECTDEREILYEDDPLYFDLYLFGETIIYAGVFINAIIKLGEQGLIDKSNKFRVISIESMGNSSLMDNGEMVLNNLIVATVNDYIKRRLRQIDFRGKSNRIIFETPAQFKHNGEFIKEYDIDVLIKAIQRRIYMLDCFEGIDGEVLFAYDLASPSIIEQKVESVMIPRYSSTHNKKLIIEGIKGYIQLDDFNNELLLKLLLAGEVIHVGKLTSFGLGKYVVR